MSRGFLAPNWRCITATDPDDLIHQLEAAAENGWGLRGFTHADTGFVALLEDLTDGEELAETQN